MTNLETLQAILINYVPAITVLVGFLASCWGFIKQLKKSDVTKVREELKESGSKTNKKIDELVDLTKLLMQENAELKKYNAKLLEELTRISDYEEE